MNKLISGMTGFGRADGALDGWTWTVEARSVNGRTLETRFRGPGGFDNLERLAKAAAQARLNRGQVTLGLQAKRAEGFEPAPRVNEAVLATYLRLANQLAEEGATPPSADGLPPTPIANPGEEALKAVLNPPRSEYIFFVADGTGGHVFARTYQEHLLNVARWREIERRKAGLAPGQGAPETSPAPMTDEAAPAIAIPPGAKVIRVPTEAGR